MESKASHIERRSKDPITPIQQLGSPQQASNGLEASSPYSPEVESLARPSPARSADSTSSEDSFQSYDTPMTSPETSSQETAFQLAKSEEKTPFAQLPPTPTPSPRVRYRSLRSSSAGVKPLAKTRKRKGGVKTARTTDLRKLFEDDGSHENDPTISELSEKLGLLAIPASANAVGDHREINKNNGKSEEKSRRSECDRCPEIQGQHSSGDKLQQENMDTKHKGGGALEASAENHTDLEIPGAFPETQLCASSVIQPESSDPQVPLETTGEIEILEETIRAYPSFERKHQSDLSQYKIHQSIATELRRPLAKSSSPGYSYILRLPSEQTKYIKIGRTGGETEKRTEQIRKACDLGKLLILWEHSLPIPNHERVERLVHKELLNINCTFQCRVCTKKGTSEPKTHNEWFLFDSDRASRVVARWNKWLYHSEPYDVRGELKPFWRDRLEKFKGYGLANGLRPQDMSKVPWSFEQTARFWDRWVEPSAIEIWWFHLCRTFNFSWTFFQRCVMALRDPANVRTAVTSLMFMTVGSFALSMTQRLCLGALCWIPVLLSNLCTGSDERLANRQKKRA
jgi:hypothetical protein